jgi:hypothetical protein
VTGSHRLDRSSADAALGAGALRVAIGAEALRGYVAAAVRAASPA